MGTNYYLKTNKCEHCGRADEPVHIGKSSGGWCFSLHVIPEDGINSLADWEARWPTGVIENEYGETITPEEMRKIITERSREKPVAWRAFDYDQSHAEPGPANLLRHRLGRYCVGHGEGTWDLIPGCFS